MKREPFRKIWQTGRSLFGGMPDSMHFGEPESSAPTRSSLLPEQSLDADRPTTIRELMTPNPRFTQVDAPLHEALDLLIREDFSALPVLDDDGRVVGLLNERHLLRALGDQEAATVSRIMDPAPVTVGVDEALVEVVDRLMAINVRQVLVLEGSRLVGVVTRADLMPTILLVLRELTRRMQSVSRAIH